MNIVSLSNLENDDEPFPHIAFFIATLKGGGAERIIINLANYFAEQGLRVDLVVCKAVGELKEFVPENVRCVDLTQKRVVFSLPAYIDYLNRVKPEVVLSSVERPVILSGFGKMLSRHPHRLYMRLANSLFENVPLWKQLYNAVWCGLFAVSYTATDGVFAISKGISNQLTKNPFFITKPIHLVYNPSIRPNFESLMKEDPVYPNGYKREGVPTIVAVGRLYPQKDYPTLIRAFARVHAKMPCQLLILGEGPLLGKLQKIAKKLKVDGDIHFLGFVNNPLSIIYRAQAYVMSSAWEGLPGALIEALSTGIPVISTDCPTGPSEILEDGRFGKLVPVGDDEALADGIVDILNSPRKPISDALAEHLEQFKVETGSRKYFDIIFGDKV